MKSGTKGKFILRRKEEFMNFRIKEKLVLWISGSKKKKSSKTHEVNLPIGGWGMGWRCFGPIKKAIR